MTYISRLILVSALFFSLAKLALSISFVQSNITLFWLPAGFSIAVLLIGGFKYLPGISIGAFFANLFTEAPLGFALIAAMANTIEPITAVYILIRKFHFDRSLAKIKDAILFLFFGVFVSPILSAFIGAFGLYINGMLEWKDFFRAAFSWWAGDAFGILTLGTLILVLSTKYRLNLTTKKVLERVSCLFLILTIQTIIYFDIFESLPIKYFTWLVFPLLIWASLRFSPKTAIVFAFVAIIVAVFGTVNNHGPFFTGITNTSLILLYSFICFVMINTVILSITTTERLEKENAIEHLYKERDAIFNSTNDLIWSVDTNFNLLSANYAFIHRTKTISGQTLEIGKSVFGQGIFPSKVLNFWENLYKRGIAGESIKTETTSMADDVPYTRWLDLNINPIIKNNSIIGVACFCKDITERKLAEEKLQKKEQQLRLAISGGDLGMWDWNFQSGELEVNDLWILMLGLDPQIDKPTIHSWSSLVHPDDTHKLDKIVKEVFLNPQGKSFEVEIRARHKDGNYIWILDKGAVVERDNNDLPLRIAGTHIDITRQKLVEEELIKAKEQADSANNTKSEFLTNMSHEIRTPLNAIIGFTDLLSISNLNQTQKQYLSIILKSANSLLELLNEILDFAKIETGNIKLHIEKIDLFELIEQVKEIIQFKAQTKGIKVFINISKETPRVIWTDPVRLRQILMNLLSNSIKFTDHGEIETSIEANDYNPQTKEIKISFSVRDTGIGISQSDQKKIFDAFSQVDTSNKRKFGGTGLGLTISNELLALMNSTLEVKSELGVGSIFYFTIQVDAEFAERNSIPLKLNENNYLNNNFKILVVDDDVINLSLIKTIIGKILPNAILIEAVNGRDAVELFMKEKPDIIFLDIQMPEMNGHEATAEIRKLETDKKTPIIAVTAGVTHGSREKCFAYGMDDYTNKPVTKTKLEQLIHKWLLTSEN